MVARPQIPKDYSPEQLRLLAGQFRRWSDELDLAAFVAATTDPVTLVEPTLEPITTPTKTVSPQPVLNMSVFNSIESGMTYAEVIAIAGNPTQQLSEVEIAGANAAVYSWESGFSNMSITFSNGSVSGKAQFGLK